MHRLLLTLVVLTVGVNLSFGQTKTIEKRVEVDSATGQVKTVSSEVVSTTEDITPRNHMLVINPLKFFWMYNLSYYQKLSQSAVIGGGLQMPVFEGLGGFGANAEVRFHPSAKAMRGFYVAPNVSYTILSFDSYTYDGQNSHYEEMSIGAVSVGVLVGWQWFPGDDFAMGLGIGVDQYFLTDKTTNSSASTYDGTLPALRFDLGYAW